MSATYRLVGASLGQLEPVWIIHLEACCREFGVVGWQQVLWGLLTEFGGVGCFGTEFGSLGLYVSNLQGSLD